MAARRNRKTGRMTKSSRSRTNKFKGAVSVPQTLATLVSVNAISKALTGLGPIDFIGLGDANDSGWSKDGNGSPNNITLQEVMKGSSIRSSTPLGAAMKANLMSNGIGAIGMVAGFKVVEKLVKGLGLNRQMNKVVRSVGFGKMVKF